MDEYISKQNVLDYLNGYLHSLGKGGADSPLFDRGQRRALINSIQDILAIKAKEVQPVKHGKWKYYKNNGIIDTYICTNCQGKVEMAIDVEPSRFKYCPNCGAKMIKDGEQND